MIFGEAARSIRASMSTTVAATMTVLIGMFLLGLSIAFGTWMLSWSNHAKSQIEVKVFFCTPIEEGCTRDATPKEINAVRARLIRMPEVRKITFVSKAEALRRMQRQHRELVAGLPSNPLPNAYEVIPKRGEYGKVIRQKLAKPFPRGVHKVQGGGETERSILRVGKIVESIFLIGVVLLLVASTLLIANTIRLSIFARRREVEVMKLVGATNWFVRGPFMLEGLVCGLAGSLLAVLLLVLGKELALPAILGRIDDSTDARSIAFELNALIIVGAGLLLGAAGSGITLRRFLRV